MKTVISAEFKETEELIGEFKEKGIIYQANGFDEVDGKVDTGTFLEARGLLCKKKQVERLDGREINRG